MNSPVNTIESKRRQRGSGPGAPASGGPGPEWDRYPPSFDHARPSTAKLFRIAMIGVIVAVAMTFFGLCGAYVFLVAQPHAWRSIAFPWLVWVSTALISISSYVLTRARREIERGRVPAGSSRLAGAVALGFGFLLCQAGAWYQLARTSLFEAGNQQRSFLVILSVTHGAHVLAGLAGLLYLWFRARRNSSAGKFPLPAAVKTIGLLWHFLTGIWLFVLLLLLVWK